MKCPKYGIEIDQICHVFCAEGKHCRKDFIPIKEDQVRAMRREIIIAMLNDDDILRQQVEIYLK